MIRDPSDGSVKQPAPAPEPGIDTSKHGANYGLKTTIPERPKSTFKAPSAEELAKHYATHNLGFQPKEEGQ